MALPADAGKLVAAVGQPGGAAEKVGNGEESAVTVEGPGVAPPLGEGVVAAVAAA